MYLKVFKVLILFSVGNSGYIMTVIISVVLHSKIYKIPLCSWKNNNNLLEGEKRVNFSSFLYQGSWNYEAIVSHMYLNEEWGGRGIKTSLEFMLNTRANEFSGEIMKVKTSEKVDFRLCISFVITSVCLCYRIVLNQTVYLGKTTPLHFKTKFFLFDFVSFFSRLTYILPLSNGFLQFFTSSIPTWTTVSYLQTLDNQLHTEKNVS